MVKHVSGIRLSVSAFEQSSFKAIHRGLNHKVVWSRIEALGREAPEKVTIHLTGGPPIYDALPETVGKLRSFGYRRFRLLPLWSRGGLKSISRDGKRRRSLIKSLDLKAGESEFLRQSPWKTGASWLKRGMRNRNYCPVGDQSLTILANGQYLGCFQDFGETYLEGNIESTNIQTFLKKRRLTLGKLPICTGCEASSVTKLAKMALGR